MAAKMMPRYNEMELIDIKSICLNDFLQDEYFLFPYSHFCRQALFNQAPIDGKKLHDGGSHQDEENVLL